jgi:hypothetical protein
LKIKKDEPETASWTKDEEIDYLRSELSKYKKIESELSKVISCKNLGPEWGGSRVKDEHGHYDKIQFKVHPWFAGRIQGALKLFPLNYFESYSDFLRLIQALGIKCLHLIGNDVVHQNIRENKLFDIFMEMNKKQRDEKLWKNYMRMKNQITPDRDIMITEIEEFIKKKE